MAIVGAIAVGIIIGFILCWMLNTAMRNILWDTAAASRVKGKQDEVKRLRKEVHRLNRKIEQGRNARQRKAKSYEDMIDDGWIPPDEADDDDEDKIDFEF